MTDERNFRGLENVITGVMRVGVALSASVLVVGLAMAFCGVPASQRVLNAGIMLLMAIPAARILVSLVDAAYRRDALLACATVYVSLVLAGQIFHWFK